MVTLDNVVEFHIAFFEKYPKLQVVHFLKALSCDLSKYMDIQSTICESYLFCFKLLQVILWGAIILAYFHYAAINLTK